MKRDGGEPHMTGDDRDAPFWMSQAYPGNLAPFVEVDGALRSLAKGAATRLPRPLREQTISDIDAVRERLRLNVVVKSSEHVRRGTLADLKQTLSDMERIHSTSRHERRPPVESLGIIRAFMGWLSKRRGDA